METNRSTMRAQEERSKEEQKEESIFMMIQFLNEHKYNDTLHQLERESGSFFDMEYFKELVLNGNWEESETYLSGFTKLEDEGSKIIFLELRKQKYYEALDRGDQATAAIILKNELKGFGERIVKHLAGLLALDDFREEKQLANYPRPATAERSELMLKLEENLKNNSLMHNKLKHPDLPFATLWDQLIQRQTNFSLGGQRSINQTDISTPQHVDFYPTASNVFRPLVLGVNPVGPRRSLSVNNDYANIRPPGTSDGMRMPPIGLDRSTDSRVLNKAADLPITVIRTLNQGLRHSNLTSMDFHPVLSTLLLVGNDKGGIELWEVGSGEKLVSGNIVSNSESHRSSLVNDSCPAVTCAKWSPTGFFFGVAYKKGILDVCSYRGKANVQGHRHIEAHIGSVNDLAFAIPHCRLLTVTCGDDKTIKMWDVETGARLITLGVHDSPGCSVFNYVKDKVLFLSATFTDGKMISWAYHSSGAQLIGNEKIDGVCARAAYGKTDGRRLFSCVSSLDNGKRQLIELRFKDGGVRLYNELQTPSKDILQFDTTKNRYLAAGDNHVIKFWEMDSANVLETSDAGGDLPAIPRVHFNRDGTLLAASTKNNQIKILATSGLLQAYKTHQSIVTKQKEVGEGSRKHYSA